MSTYVRVRPTLIPQPSRRTSTGSLRAPLDWEGREYSAIEDHDRLAPFLMAVVSSTTRGCSSRASAFRRPGADRPASSLFPYQTDDRLHDSAGVAGPHTSIRVTRGGATTLWRPLDGRGTETFRLERRLLKTTHCEAVMFEERNLDLRPHLPGVLGGVPGFGWIRRARWSTRARTRASRSSTVSSGSCRRTPIGPCRPSSAPCWTRTGWRRWRPRAASDSSASARSRSTSLAEREPARDHGLLHRSRRLDLLSAAQIAAFEGRGQVTAEPSSGASAARSSSAAHSSSLPGAQAVAAGGRRGTGRRRGRGAHGGAPRHRRGHPREDQALP